MTEQPNPYEMIGGEQGVRKLVERFYDIMDLDEYAAEIRTMHAKSLKISREKLFLFLSGWLGGPDLYVEKYGHPRLRRRHLPFPINRGARDQWMYCMTKALSEMNLEDGFRKHLEFSFWKTADHMRNQPEDDEERTLPILTGIISKTD